MAPKNPPPGPPNPPAPPSARVLAFPAKNLQWPSVPVELDKHNYIDIENEVDGEHERLQNLAAHYSSSPALTHFLPLPTLWAWQTTLVEDAEQSTKLGPVLRMLEVIQAHERILHEWPAMCREIFSALYSGLDDVVVGSSMNLEEIVGEDAVEDVMPPEQAALIRAPSPLGSMVLTWLTNLDTWDALARSCHKRRAIAMTTAAQIANTLAREIFELPSLHEGEASRSPEEIYEQAENLLRQGVHADTVAALLDASLEDSSARRTALMKKLHIESPAVAALSQLMASLLASLLANAVQLGQMQDLLAECGLGPSALNETSDPVSLELLKQLRAIKDIKEFISLVGRMERNARGKMGTSVLRIRPEGVHKSQVDLLASEWAMEDAAPDVWAQRFHDKETLGLLRVGEEPQASGDLVLVLDDSGSMSGPPRKWCRALATALVLEAVKMRRRCVVALYSSMGWGNDQYSDVEVLTAADLPKLFDLFKTVYDGGTSTRLALLRAAKRLAPPLRNPDTLLITDGEWEQLKEDDFAELRGPHGDGRLYCLLLAPGHTVPKQVPGATATWTIPELTLEATKRVLQTLRSKAPLTNRESVPLDAESLSTSR